MVIAKSPHKINFNLNQYYLVLSPIQRSITLDCILLVLHVLWFIFDLTQIWTIGLDLILAGLNFK